MTWAIPSQESDFLGSTIWSGERHDQNSVKEISGHASSDLKARGREGSDPGTPAGQEISNHAKATDHENSSRVKENGMTTIEIGVLSLKEVDLQGITEPIGRGRESTVRIGGCKDHVAANTKGTPQAQHYFHIHQGLPFYPVNS